jgi:hypothetical protein
VIGVGLVPIVIFIWEVHFERRSSARGASIGSCFIVLLGYHLAGVGAGLLH